VVKGYTVAALVLSGLGLLGLIFTLSSHGDVRDYIAKHYRAQPDERLDERAKPTKVFKSSKTVSKTARDIADAHKPAERRTTPEGAFLRYSDDIVSVLPVAGGSRILVDDEDTGYRRNYFFVGGFWGRYSGPGESFRGGGPGVGK
jgi:hypothetical protein